MKNQNMTSGDRAPLTMTWVPVRDARGRVHMEAHWTSPVTQPTTARTAA